MSYLDLARRLQRRGADEPAPAAAVILDAAASALLVREAFESVAAENVDGALFLLDTDQDLSRRFHATEAAIDAAAKAGPTEGALRAALDAHVAVIRECIERKRAQQEQTI